MTIRCNHCEAEAINPGALGVSCPCGHGTFVTTQPMASIVFSPSRPYRIGDAVMALPRETWWVRTIRRLRRRPLVPVQYACTYDGVELRAR